MKFRTFLPLFLTFVAVSAQFAQANTAFELAGIVEASPRLPRITIPTTDHQQPQIPTRNCTNEDNPKLFGCLCYFADIGEILVGNPDDIFKGKKLKKFISDCAKDVGSKVSKLRKFCNRFNTRRGKLPIEKAIRKLQKEFRKCFGLPNKVKFRRPVRP